MFTCRSDSHTALPLTLLLESKIRKSLPSITSQGDLHFAIFLYARHRIKRDGLVREEVKTRASAHRLTRKAKHRSQSSLCAVQVNWMQSRTSIRMKRYLRDLLLQNKYHNCPSESLVMSLFCRRMWKLSETRRYAKWFKIMTNTNRHGRLWTAGEFRDCRHLC